MNSPEDKSSNKDSRPDGLPHDNAGQSSTNLDSRQVVVALEPESADLEGDEKFIPRFSEVRSKRGNESVSSSQELSQMVEPGQTSFEQASGEVVHAISAIKPNRDQTAAIPIEVAGTSALSPDVQSLLEGRDATHQPTVAAPASPDMAAASLAIEILAISSFDKFEAVSADAAANLLPKMESMGSVDVQELGFHRHISDESQAVDTEQSFEKHSPTSTYYDALISQHAVPAIELPVSASSDQGGHVTAPASHVLLGQQARPSTYWVVDEARLVMHGAFADFSQSSVSDLKKEPEQEIAHTLPIADMEEAVALNAIPVSGLGAGISYPAAPLTLESIKVDDSTSTARTHSPSTVDAHAGSVANINPIAGPPESSQPPDASRRPAREPLPDSLADSAGFGRFVEANKEREQSAIQQSVAQGPQALDLSDSPKRSSTVDTGPLPLIDSTTHSGALKTSGSRVKSPFLERAIGNSPAIIASGNVRAQTDVASQDQPQKPSSQKVAPLRLNKQLWKKRAFTVGSILILCIACFAVMYDTVKSGKTQAPQTDEKEGEVDESMSQSTEAADAVKEKAESAPEIKLDAKEALKLAIKEEKDKNYSEALEHYNAALVSRKTVKALHGRGRVLTKLQRFDDALKDLELASKISPTNQDVIIDLAAVKYLLNDFAGAVDDYNRILAVKPEDPDALYGRGISLSGLKDNSAAIKDFEQVVKLRPAYWRAYRQMCTTYMEMGQNDKAEAAITVALTACGEDPDLFFSRGLARYRMGHNVDGLEDYNRAIKLDPKRKEFYNDRGYVLMQLGKNDEAAGDFQKALEIDPDYTLASENLSKVQTKHEK